KRAPDYLKLSRTNKFTDESPERGCRRICRPSKGNTPGLSSFSPQCRSKQVVKEVSCRGRSTIIVLWSEICSGMLSFSSLRERNTDILYQRRALRRGPDSYANGPFGVITVGPERAAIQIAQAKVYFTCSTLMAHGKSNKGD